MNRITKLCDGDCGNVFSKDDLTKTAYNNDYLCNDCMFDFIVEQEYEESK